MRLPRPSPAFGLFLALGVGCVSGAIPAAPEDVTLNATDYRGVPQQLNQLPRRPRLRLHHAHGVLPGGQSYVLLPGAPSETLLDDLARAPLRAEHALSQLSTDEELAADALVVTPAQALEPDADYVLAVPAWAKSRRGTPLTPHGESIVFALHTAAGDDAGARLRSTWPMDGASAVAPRLSAALVAFDGRVEGAESGIWLEGADGLAVPVQLDAGECARLAPEHAARYCVRLQPIASLAPDAPYAIVVGGGALDAHGAPVGPVRAEFRTGLTSDGAPPVPRSPTCAVDELPLEFGCALSDDSSIRLRSSVDEAAIVFLRIGDRRLAATTPAGEFALRAGELASDAPFELELRLLDSAGNEAVHRVSLHTTAPLAALSISEILADPLGPEPNQEWIELLNYGDRPIDLHGFTLGDRPDALGQALADAPLSIAPHTRALLVGAGYDPAQGSDPMPPPGAMLVRLPKALTGSGLSNAGEALFLRDAQGRRISAAPALPRPRPGVCAVRVTFEMRDDSDGGFDHAQTCSPGR